MQEAGSRARARDAVVAHSMTPPARSRLRVATELAAGKECGMRERVREITREISTGEISVREIMSEIIGEYMRGGGLNSPVPASMCRAAGSRPTQCVRKSLEHTGAHPLGIHRRATMPCRVEFTNPHQAEVR